MLKGVRTKYPPRICGCSQSLYKPDGRQRAQTEHFIAESKHHLTEKQTTSREPKVQATLQTRLNPRHFQHTGSFHSTCMAHAQKGADVGHHKDEHISPYKQQTLGASNNLCKLESNCFESSLNQFEWVLNHMGVKCAFESIGLASQIGIACLLNQKRFKWPTFSKQQALGKDVVDVLWKCKSIRAMVNGATMMGKQAKRWIKMMIAAAQHTTAARAQSLSSQAGAQRAATQPPVASFRSLSRPSSDSTASRASEDHAALGSPTSMTGPALLLI